MLKVGLTGGIGAGKSAVATRLAGHGAVLVDADRVAREVVAPGSDGLRAVLAEFGAGLLAADGSLDRAALAATVFGDDAARRRLEGILHPRVRARTAELVAGAPTDAIVVNDVPLLVETGLAATYHLVVVVEAELPTRVDRLVRDRGMSVEQAHARIRAQAGDQPRRAAADVLLSNDGTPAELAERVDRLWRSRLLDYEANLRHGRPAATGPGRLVERDPDWPVQAARLIARIGHAVGAHRLDHVGSTAVPDLPARDVIDLQLGVDSPQAADELAATLAAAGFPRVPGGWPDEAGAGTSSRRHAAADPGRPVDLYVVVSGSPEWRRSLLIRDHLRADAAARSAYAAAKRTAADGPAAAYDAAARSWLQHRYPAAERWAAATGWRP